jgi:hypothetical protein
MYRPIALVVEDDFLQRSSIALLLEDREMDVFQCESAEAAELVLQKAGGATCSPPHSRTHPRKCYPIMGFQRWDWHNCSRDL